MKTPTEMTLGEYLGIMFRLGLKPCGKRTSILLGISVRQLQRIHMRQASIPAPVQRLLSLYDAVLKDCPKIPNKWEAWPSDKRPPGSPSPYVEQRAAKEANG
jgi:hypothetical protein